MTKVIGYCRVSTDKQDYERQKSDILNYAHKEKLVVSEFVNETISSRKKDRLIFGLIDSLKKGDILLVTELSRIGRSMNETIMLCGKAVEQGITIMITSDTSIIKVLDGSPMSIVQVTMLAFYSQVERDHTSERTISALRERKKQGVILGRPIGKGVKALKKEKDFGMSIEEMLKSGITQKRIAENLGVARQTVSALIKEKGLNK